MRSTQSIRELPRATTAPPWKRWKSGRCGTSASRNSKHRPSGRARATFRPTRTELSGAAHNLTPRDGRDVEDAVQWALANGKALEIVGHGSKRAIGRPAQTDVTLELSGLAGVTLYEPEELVLSARAGTPLADIEALLAAKNQ